MMGRDHVLMGALAGAGLAGVVGTSAEPALALTILATSAGAAALPDIDEPGSTVAHLVGPLTVPVAWVTGKLAGGHRHATHSLLAVVAAGALGACTALNHQAAAVIVGLMATLAWRAAAPGRLGHGVICPLVGAAVGALAWYHPAGPVLGAALAIGVATHLLGDVLTQEGVPLLWPNSHHTALPLLGHTDSLRERLLAPALALAALLATVALLAPPTIPAAEHVANRAVAGLTGIWHRAAGAVGEGGARPAGPAPLTVYTEPTTGMAPVESLVASAHTAVQIEIYELADPTLEAALAADQARGVDVKVLMDTAYHGGAVNAAAYAYLHAHGVPVKWANATEIFHEKSVCVDYVCLIGTGNLVAADYPSTRDFWVQDTIPTDVAAIDGTFAGDWAGTAPGPAAPGSDLLWSPGARTGLLAVIASARRTVLVESEEISATVIVTALVTSARRGVSVTLIMTTAPSWASAFSRLRAAGVHVVAMPATANPYIHAKAIVADGTEAFVGSQNFSYASLDHDRELGLVTSDPAVVDPLSAALQKDAAR